MLKADSSMTQRILRGILQNQNILGIGVMVTMKLKWREKTSLIQYLNSSNKAISRIINIGKTQSGVWGTN